MPHILGKLPCMAARTHSNQLLLPPLHFSTRKPLAASKLSLEPSSTTLKSIHVSSPASTNFGSVQAAPTTDDNDKVQILMDYLHDHPEGVLRYHAINMIDAVYLCSPKSSLPRCYLVYPRQRSNNSSCSHGQCIHPYHVQYYKECDVLFC